MATFEEFADLALSLPQTHMRLTWGSAYTYRVGEKIFAMGAPDGAHVSLKASPQEQRELVAADPDTFAPAAYVGRFGWIRVTLARTDPGELAELLTEAWRRTAPKRLVRAFDETHGARATHAPKGGQRA